MRATEAIKQLEELIKRHGDCHLVKEVEDCSWGVYEMDSIEEIEVVTEHETAYFKFK